jgi:hypothetical protein
MAGSRPPALWLSCHAAYACRHSGACCSAGWPLPVEAPVAAGIELAVASGGVGTIDGRRAWLVASATAPPGVAGTFRLVDRACVFHVPRPDGERPAGGDGARHCAIHATLGQEALPASCRHFPRVCLIDDRGVRVTLSHFCPTAAAVLVDDDRPVAIVAGPEPVPGVDVPEGLDARGQLPPRLTDRTLADWEGLSAWEAFVVARLTGPRAGRDVPERALLDLARDADRLARWRPGTSTLRDAIAELDGARDRAPLRVGSGPPMLDTAGAARSLDLVRQACRAPWTWPAAPPDLGAADAAWVAPVWPEWTRVVRRYLAAKAFASWMTYRLDASRGLVTWLTVALDVLRVECVRACAAAGRPLARDLLIDAVRRADLLLVHYADAGAIAEAIARESPTAGRERTRARPQPGTGPR